MVKLRERTRRGLTEAIGVPTIIGALALVLLVLSRMFGATA